MQNSEFYNLLSSHYDDMIKFGNSLQNKVEWLSAFIKPNYKSALDLGCGTGVDSIALSKLGFSVDAVDHSENMITIAKENSKKYETKIHFQISDLTKNNFNKKYDFIVSLGNTLANISLEDLSKVIANSSSNLNPLGKIVFQIINFSSISKEEDFILNTFENDKIKIIRKYIFESDETKFVIEILDKLTNDAKLITTKMFEHSQNDLIRLANQNNLKINFYGSLSKQEYYSGSKDLVICIKK